MTKDEITQMAQEAKMKEIKCIARVSGSTYLFRYEIYVEENAAEEEIEQAMLDGAIECVHLECYIDDGTEDD